MDAELQREAEHLMTVCNSCRYCEAYCAAWQSMERRLVFNPGDLNYLANLCHGCSDCYYACQYAPPHEFNINPPLTFAKIRLESYQQYAWPQPLAKLFNKNGVVVSLLTALMLIVFVFGAVLVVGSDRLFSPVPGAKLYDITPNRFLVTTFSAVFLYSILALVIGFLRFWRDTGGKFGTFLRPVTLARGLWDVLTLHYLDNNGFGCTYPKQEDSQSRRWFHHFTFYGFLLCFAATATATIYEDFLNWLPPYGYTSLPVVFGTLGGIGLMIGPTGLYILKLRRNRELTDEKQVGMDVSFLLLLFLTSVTGLLLLAFRTTAAMGTLLVIHLAFVMTLFLTIPYGKFVHSVYRFAALVKFALEGSRAPEHKIAAEHVHAARQSL